MNNFQIQIITILWKGTPETQSSDHLPWLLWFHLYRTVRLYLVGPRILPCPQLPWDQGDPAGPWKQKDQLKCFHQGPDWFEGNTLKVHICIQLTGGPLLPAAPLDPDFPFWPWSIKSSCSTVLVLLHDRKSRLKIMHVSKQSYHYHLCPYLITFGSFQTWLSLRARMSLKY